MGCGTGMGVDEGKSFVPVMVEIAQSVVTSSPKRLVFICPGSRRIVLM